MPPMATATRLRTVEQVAAECPAFSVAAIRWLIYSDATFNDACVVRIRRQVFVDLDLMDRWLEAQRGQRSVVMEAQRRKAAGPASTRRRRSQPNGRRRDEVGRSSEAASG